MERIQLGIVGCGGMGGRHLFGLQELAQTEMNNVELVAACDLRRDNAAHLADEAERLLGQRPRVFEDMAAMVRALPDLQAVAITTDAGSHHIVTTIALELGLHVLSEKPLALTIRGCNRIIEAQERSGLILSVAENYRRDPMSRLTKAILEADVIGRPTMFFDVSAGGGDRIVILPWRHDKNRGGILIDAGVHNADMMQYYLGDVREVYARTQRWEPVRHKPDTGAGPGGFYARWYADMPDRVEATAEDTLMAVLTFESGALGQWTQSYAAHGKGFGQRVVYGTRGSMRPGGTRNGISPVVQLDDGREITGDDLLPLVPDFHLDAITTRLFGSARLASYDEPFQMADRRLLAIEYHEFARCVQTGETPEVDALAGRSALAVCYAALESGALNRPITVAEVEAEGVNAYAGEIDAHWEIQP